jgi:tryptophan halogenase
MSQARELPGRIVVAGAGQVGVLAAIALRKALPASEVLVIAGEVDPGALADRFGTALPFTNRLHDRLGIGEDELVKRCGASHRLVMRYRGWAGPDSEALAAYGAVIDARMKTAFAREWGGGPRNAGVGRLPGSVGEVLAETNRFAPPPPDAGHPLADVDYALRWSVPAYRDLLVRMAERLGVKYVEGAPREVIYDGNGTVTAVAVDGAGDVTGDFFIDCTGPRALILSCVPGFARNDWEDILPERRVLIAKPSRAMLALEDRLTLTPAGWLQQYAGRDGMLGMLGMGDRVSQQDGVANLAGEPEALLRIFQGRATRSWISNVVALGDAAAHFEPMGWLNLDLAHRQLGLLLELLPGRVPDPRERDEFNRRAGMMADRVRDVLSLHYQAPAAKAVFGDLPISPEMELTLDQYRRRGRLPYFEEMPFVTQEWGHLLGALGIEGGEGPMQSAGFGEDPRAASMAFERQCEAAVQAAPLYPDWMRKVLEPVRQ